MSQFEDETESMYAAKPPESSQRGCLFYGCLIAAILSIVFAVVIGVGLFFLYRFANRVIQQYSDTAPIALPAPALNEDEVKSLLARWESFRKAVEEGREASLVLTGDELTVLVQRNENFKNRVAFTIEGDEIKGQVSFPLDEIPLMKGRYLNAKGTFKATMEDGLLFVTLEKAEVKGKPIPEEFMGDFRKTNLAQDAYKNEENARLLRRIESLEVKDDKITIKSRASKPPAESQPESKVETPPEP